MATWMRAARMWITWHCSHKWLARSGRVHSSDQKDLVSTWRHYEKHPRNSSGKQLRIYLICRGIWTSTSMRLSSQPSCETPWQDFPNHAESSAEGVHLGQSLGDQRSAQSTQKEIVPKTPNTEIVWHWCGATSVARRFGSRHSTQQASVVGTTMCACWLEGSDSLTQKTQSSIEDMFTRWPKELLWTDFARSKPYSSISSSQASQGPWSSWKEAKVLPTGLWRHHFEHMEDGHTIGPEALLELCHNSQQARQMPLPDWREIPTLHDLESSLRQNQYGKSALFDGLPPDACHKFANVIARAFFPLFLKQTLLGHEPITFKGGILVHAFKGRGSAGRCDNHRALMISSVLAKATHRILRKDLMATFQHQALPLQVGGLPGRAVGQGAHCLLAFSSLCKQRKLAAGILFVDIRQAFYRMIRSHVVSISSLDDSIARLFATLELPQESFAEFAAEIENSTAVQDAGISPFLSEHLAESSLYTWFQLPSDGRISQTRKGSRPGDNLADLLFSFAFRKILRAVMDELRTLDIDLSFESIADRNPYPYQTESNQEIVFDTLGPVWADDLAVLIWDECPQRVVGKAAVTARVLIDALALRGMEVNLEKGKTEFIFDIRGRGAHEVKARIFRHSDPVVPINSRLLDTIFVRVVTHYKHLGTIYTSGGKMSAEIRNRLGQAKQEFRRFRKYIYSNPHLACKSRIALFQTMVMTRLLFDIAIWPALSVHEKKLFEEGVHGLYASLGLALWGDQVFGWRQDRLRARLGLPHPEVLARVARLRHLYHLCLKADDYVWSFLHLELRWLQLVREDITWLRSQIPRRLPQTDPHDDWQPWLQDMHFGKRWQRNINVAMKHTVLQTTKSSDWQTWHRTFLEILNKADLWQPTKTASMKGGHACLRCQKVFKSDQAWAVHAFVIHGRCTPSRRYAEGTQCAICMKEYAFHSRLVNHLRHSKKCVREMQRRGITAATEPSIGSRQEAKVQAINRSIPVLRVHGPLEDMTADPPPEDHWTRAEEQFIESILDVIEKVRQERCGALEMTTLLWPVLQNSILRIHDMKKILVRVVQDFAISIDMEDEEDQWLQNTLVATLEHVEEIWSPQWLMGHLTGDKEESSLGDGTLDAVKEVEALTQMAAARPRVGRPFASRQLVFLHLFSGQRRSGDLQEAIELFAAEHCLHVRALSVDVVISLEHGDLLKHDTQRIFMDAVIQGWVCGMAAGPPCETWSRARENQLSTGDGPRPVRTIAVPEGKPQLSLREIQQVLFGNQLLAISVLLLVLCWLHGVCGVLEHPAEPPKATSVSIWRLPILRFLEKQHQVQAVTIMQGYYGAYSCKPTRLMFTHPSSSLETLLQQARTCEHLPATTSIGRSKDGTFKTSGLKTYPPGLCTAIALAWGHSFLPHTRTLPGTDVSPPSTFAAAFDSLHSAVSKGATHGPDFCTDAQYQPAWVDLSRGGVRTRKEFAVHDGSGSSLAERKKKMYVYVYMSYPWNALVTSRLLVHLADQNNKQLVNLL